MSTQNTLGGLFTGMARARVRQQQQEMADEESRRDTLLKVLPSLIDRLPAERQTEVTSILTGIATGKMDSKKAGQMLPDLLRDVQMTEQTTSQMPNITLPQLPGYGPPPSVDLPVPPVQGAITEAVPVMEAGRREQAKAEEAALRGRYRAQYEMEREFAAKEPPAAGGISQFEIEDPVGSGKWFRVSKDERTGQEFWRQPIAPPEARAMAQPQIGAPKEVNVTPRDGKKYTTMAVYNETTGKWIDTNTNQPIDGKVSEKQPSKEKPALTPNAEAAMIRQLANQWTVAIKPTIEIQRQVQLMDVGMRAAEAGKLAAGAQMILVTFQKILDPPSVVRESEFMRSAAGQSLMNRVRGYIERLRAGGAGIPLAELRHFAQLAREAAELQRTGYLDSVRKRLELTADRYNVPHELVITELPVLPEIGTKPPPAAPGESPGTVQMRTPDGQVWDVPVDKVDTTKARYPGTLVIP